MEVRAPFLQKEEQSRFIGIQRRNLGLNRFAGNWVSPFVGFGGNGCGFNGESSSVRDYGGTGVFLPRIPSNINNNGGKKQGKSIISSSYVARILQKRWRMLVEFNNDKDVSTFLKSVSNIIVLSY